MFPEQSKKFIINQTQLILKSYRHWFGRNLHSVSEDAEKIAEEIFLAPFILLSSNNAEDPILNYGNKRGLELWEMSFEELTKTPGRKTAETDERRKREAFLQQVKEKGFVDNYEGVRISKTGKRFEIKNATVWNLINDSNDYAGQAATFTNWKYL